MDQLPEELLLMIFDLLPSCDMFSSVVLVCRRWATLARRRILLVERPRNLRRLHARVDTIRVVTPLLPPISPCVFLKNVSQVARYLRDLTVYAVSPFGAEHFEALGRLWHLKHLDVFLRERMLDTQLLPVMARLSSLVVNEVVSARVLRGLAATRRLRALHLYGRALYYPRREILVFLREKQHVLTELTLRCTELNDATYTAIGQCENLVTLQLYSCWLMTGEGALHVARPRRLRTLHVTGTQMVHRVAMAKFIDHLPPSLEELDLSASCFGEEHIATLAHSLPQLKVLELWRSRLTNTAVMKLAEAMQELCLLDLDLMLTDQEICELDRTHPSLLKLRCLTEHSMSVASATGQKQPAAAVPKPVTRRLKVIATDAQYPFKYFRGSGEGYRGSLFYYWTQRMEFTPIDGETASAYDDEDDFY